jgi:hypothetical protein
MATGRAAGISLRIENGIFHEGKAQYLEGIENAEVRLLCALAGPVSHNLFECYADFRDYSRFPEDAKVINSVLSTFQDEDHRTNALDLSFQLFS